MTLSWSPCWFALLVAVSHAQSLTWSRETLYSSDPSFIDSFSSLGYVQSTIFSFVHFSSSPDRTSNASYLQVIDNSALIPSPVSVRELDESASSFQCLPSSMLLMLSVPTTMATHLQMSLFKFTNSSGSFVDGMVAVGSTSNFTFLGRSELLFNLDGSVNSTLILATSSEIPDADSHNVVHKSTSSGFVLLLVVNGSVQLTCYQMLDLGVALTWQRTVLPYVVTPAFHDVGPLCIDSLTSMIVLVVPYHASFSSVLTSFLGVNMTSSGASFDMLHALILYTSNGERVFALPIPTAHCASSPRVTAVSSFGRRRRLSVAAVGSCLVSDQLHEHAWIYFASIRRNRENVMNLTHDLVLVSGFDKINQLSSRINSLSFFDAVRLLVVGSTGFETNETGSTVAGGDAMIATVDLSIGQVLHFERFPRNSFNGLFDLIPASKGSDPDYEFLTLGSWKRFRDDLVVESVYAIFRLTLRLSDRVPWWQSFPAFIGATVGGLLLFTVVSWCLIRKKRQLTAVLNSRVTIEDTDVRGSLLSPLIT